MFYLKQNDTSPAIQATLKDSTGAVVPVTGASVVFNMVPVGSTTPKVSRGAGVVVDGAAGTVKYIWSAADTDTVGTFNAEFEITFADGAVETFPNRGMISVKIEDDIA